jgi:hypothetical protein
VVQHGKGDKKNAVMAVLSVVAVTEGLIIEQ